MSNNIYGATLDSDAATANPSAAAVVPDFSAPPAPAEPDYGAVLDTDKEAQISAVKASVYSAQGLEPDRHAKVMGLAAEMHLPVDLVERNYDQLAQKRQFNTTNYGRLIDENPQFADWLKDPNHAALAKNDMEPLKSLEDTVTDHGFGTELNLAVHAAIAGFGAKLAAIPGAAMNLAYLPHNEYVAAGGDKDLPEWLRDPVNQKMLQAPDAVVNNPFYRDFKGQQEGYQTQLANISGPNSTVTKSFLAGDYARTAQLGLLQLASSAPDLVALLATTYLAGPGAAAILAGVTSGAEKSAELQNQGVDPLSGTANALGTGVINAAVMKFQMFGALHGWEQSLAAMEGKQAASEVMTGIFKTLAGTVGAQGGAGAAMSLAQDYTDYATGTNPDAFEGSGERAINAGIGGATIGLALAAPGIAAGTLGFRPPAHLSPDHQQIVNETNDALDFYMRFGQAAEATKLRKTLPEAQTQYVEQLTKNSPVENVYIDPAELETYFQKKGVNPVEAMSELGVLPEYGRAKETGSDIKIPFAKWVDKLGGTEAYQALANSIKFSPEALSINEQSKESARIKAETENAKAAAQPEVTADQSAEKVGDVVGDQLSALGLDPKQSQIYSAVFKTLGERMGVDPLELFNRYKLSITGADPEVPPSPGPEVFNPDQPANSASEQNGRVLKQSKLDTEGIPDTVVDASNRFGQRREDHESQLEAKASDVKIQKQATKFLGKDVAAKIGEMGLKMLNAFSARYRDSKDSKSIDKRIKLAQNPDLGPYVSEPKIPGIGWVPNYAAEPTGTIGPERISEPHTFKKGFGTEETDPLEWSDDKFKATKELIAKHKAADMPLTINTSSDLVGKSDYIAAMPDDTTVNMHLLTKDDALNRILFPVNPSRARQESAIKNLEDAGVRVNAIRPTYDATIKAAGGEARLTEQLGEGWQEALKKAIGTQLDVIQGGREMFQGDANSPRAQIRIGKDSMNIQILKDADRSSFLHETGHFYLEVLKNLAGDDKAPQQMKDDFAAIQTWLGNDGSELTVDQHEQFARGFEAYLMEGKAPSEGLRKIFSTFKVWLTQIYRKLKNLNVELTPEVRAVFDRILATDHEIESAQAGQNYGPLFKDPAIYGLSPDDFARYQSAIESAKLSADDKLRSKIMQDITTEENALYREQRANVKERVEREANETRVFKARSLLQLDRLPDGSPRPEGTPRLKLDRESLIAQFGEGILKKLPRMYSRDGGMDPRLAADLLGYESADQMVQELGNSKPKGEYVEAQTDAQMKAMHPDLLTSATLPEEAMSAIHNDDQAKVLRMELEFLARDNMPALKGMIKKVARRVPTDQQVREMAKSNVGGENVSDLNPGQYRVAEAKHAREAGENLAKGDIDAAFESKRLELYNHELYKAVTEARDSVKKSLRLFNKIAASDEKVSKSRDVNLVTTARAVLSAFGIGKTEDPPSTILERIKRYDPEGYATAHALVDMATAGGAGNYQDISYSRFSDMRDAVSGLWDLARSAKEIEVDGKKVSKDAVLADLSARINDHNPETGPRPGYRQAITMWEKTKVNLLSAKAMLRRTEHWVTAMDGGLKGTFRTHFWQPVVEALTKYRDAKFELIQHYLDNVVKPNAEAFGTKTVPAPEIDYTFKNKSELLGALLHTGNESNFSKLLRGRGWGDVNEAGHLNTTMWDQMTARMRREGVLTKADYDYAQGVWDMFEKTKPDAQAAHKKMYGYYFDEVTSKAFENQFGSYKGGYFPALGDPNMVENQAIRLEKEAMEQTNNSYMFPTAGRGFTKSRIEAYAPPLALDLNYIPMAIDKVLKFSHVEPTVREVGKIIMDKDFRNTLAGLDPTVASEMLIPWLQRSVTQQVSSPSGTGKAWKAADYIFRKIRGNTGLNAMAANVVNTFHQTTGISVASTMVEPHYLRDATWAYMKDAKGVTADMDEKSAFMRAKSRQVSDLQGDIDDILLHPTKFQAGTEFVKKNAYILQRMTQGVIETVAWQGAYTKAVEEGHSELEAVRSADATVRMTQHSSSPEDISRFGTGSPLARLFTMYFDYYNMKANLGVTLAGNMIRETGLKKSMPSLAGLYTSGFMIPAIMSASFYKAASGQLFNPKDDDSYMNEAMQIFFGGQANELMALAPVVGPFINNQVNRWNDNPYDDRLQLSPAIENLQKAFGAPEEIYAAIAKRGKKSSAIRDTLSLLGMMSGLPLQPLAKPIGYLSDLNDGNVRVNGPVDFARGLVTGQGQK